MEEAFRAKDWRASMLALLQEEEAAEDAEASPGTWDGKLAGGVANALGGVYKPPRAVFEVELVPGYPESRDNYHIWTYKPRFDSLLQVELVPGYPM